MYSTFAEGDVKTLRSICTDGLYESFAARIGNRRKGERVSWELVKYERRAKLVSDRAGRFPIEGAAARQAVVRIQSEQKLTRWKGGERVEGSGKVKSVDEYVVIQKQFVGWKGREWMVWGTTHETWLEDVEEWQRQELL
jgi:mitochondrial protein MBA1